MVSRPFALLALAVLLSVVAAVPPSASAVSTKAEVEKVGGELPLALRQEALREAKKLEADMSHLDTAAIAREKSLDHMAVKVVQQKRRNNVVAQKQQMTSQEEMDIRNEELAVSKQQGALAQRERVVEADLLKEKSLVRKEKADLSEEYQVETTEKKRIHAKQNALHHESELLQKERKNLASVASLLAKKQRMVAAAAQRVSNAKAGLAAGIDAEEKDASMLSQYEKEVEQEKMSLKATAAHVGKETAADRSALQSELQTVLHQKSELAEEQKKVHRDITLAMKQEQAVMAAETKRAEYIAATLKKEQAIKAKEAATAKAMRQAQKELAMATAKQQKVTAHQALISKQQQAAEAQIHKEKAHEKQMVFALQDADAKRQNDVYAVERIIAAEKKHLAAVAAKERDNEKQQAEIAEHEAAVAKQQKLVSSRELAQMHRLEEKEDDMSAETLAIEAREHAAAAKAFHVREGILSEKAIALERESDILRKKQAKIAQAETNEANELASERASLRIAAAKQENQAQAEAAKWRAAISLARKQLAALKAAKRRVIDDARVLHKEQDAARHAAAHLRRQEAREERHEKRVKRREAREIRRLKHSAQPQSLAQVSKGSISLENGGVSAAQLLQSHVHLDAKAASGTPLHVALKQDKAHHDAVDVVVTAGPVSQLQTAAKHSNRRHRRRQQKSSADSAHQPVVVVINNHGIGGIGTTTNSNNNNNPAPSAAAPPPKPPVPAVTTLPRRKRTIYIPMDPASLPNGQPPEYINVRYHLHRRLSPAAEEVATNSRVIAGDIKKSAPSAKPKGKAAEKNRKRPRKFHHFKLPKGALEDTHVKQQSYEEWMNQVSHMPERKHTNYWISTPHKTDKAVANPKIRDFDWSRAEAAHRISRNDGSFSNWVHGMWSNYFGSEEDMPSDFESKVRRMTFDIPTDKERDALEHF